MKYLGMYVHMHWGYNHPYAARTWTLDDWRGYAKGLSELGYNTIKIWPILETMPDPLTPSDIAHLEKIRKVIDILHDEFGMTAIITLGANTVGNEHAAEYTFEGRPFFKTDLRLNPGDPRELDRLINVRRNLLSYVGNADGFFIIDSDPGGYIGSTNAEFVELLWRHLDVIKEYNPNGKLFYWMHVGWEAYNRMWKAIQDTGVADIEWSPKDFIETVNLLMERPEEPWAITAGIPDHFEAVRKFGIGDRTLFYRYGIVEGEPTFPLTNYFPEYIEDGISFYDPSLMQLGAMANSQTHAVQQPGAYLYAHYIQGGTRDNLDVPGFGDKLIPGIGELLAKSWDSMYHGTTAEMRELAAQVDAKSEADLQPGPCGGLLFRSPSEYLKDLAMQMRYRADTVDFMAVMESGGEWKAPLAALVQSWRAWQQKTGFTDAYGDVQGIHAALRKLSDPAISKILDEFDDWTDPSVRHGILPRLLDAMDAKSK